jgi:hypothetical protein
MRWQDSLQADPLPWLLEREAPGVRYLALRDLCDAPADSAELRAARRAAHRRGPIAAVLAAMAPDGYWVTPGPGYNPKYTSTVWAITLLAQLGGSCDDDKRIATACAYVLDHTLAPGGQFTTNGAPSGTADCLQGNLCWALLELGCADRRLEAAFEWLARTVTGEGLAPAGTRTNGARYFAGKCGPTFACGSNNRLPCAWGGVKVVLALGRLPRTGRTPLVTRALRQGAEWLLAGDPAAAGYPNGWSAKPSGNWWKFGFPVFYVTDLVQNVEALGRAGYGVDPRLIPALALIRSKQDAAGRWPLEYDYAGKTWFDAGPKKQSNKWVTLRAARAIKACAGAGLGQ